MNDGAAVVWALADLFICGIFSVPSLSAPGEKNTLAGSHGNKPNSPPESGPRGTPEDGRRLDEAGPPALIPALEEKAFETCVKKVSPSLSSPFPFLYIRVERGQFSSVMTYRRRETSRCRKPGSTR